MCVDVIANDKCCVTQGELADALGVSLNELVMDKIYIDENGLERGRQLNSCLCPIDMQATGDRHGWKVIFHKWDDIHSGEVELTK